MANMLEASFCLTIVVIPRTWQFDAPACALCLDLLFPTSSGIDGKLDG